MRTNSTMTKKPPLNFYEIQRKQRRKSVFLILFLFLFYFIALGIISVVQLRPHPEQGSLAVSNLLEKTSCV